MARKLILHVGSPKCGSTYFQRVMLGNRSTLLESGVDYPKPEGRHPGNGLIILEKCNGDILNLFKKNDTVILSHEDLFSMAGRMTSLGEVCRENEIELMVLVFLRPFSQFIYGDYSQYLKQNIDTYIENGMAYEGMTFEEFSVNRRAQITTVAWLNSWEKVSDRPILIGSHRKIREIVESVIEGVKMDWVVNKAASNPSLRVSDCEDVARAISAGIPRGKVLEMYKSSYSKVSLLDSGKTDSRTNWLEALFKSQNEKILERFGYNNCLLMN